MDEFGSLEQKYYKGEIIEEFMSWEERDLFEKSYRAMRGPAPGGNVGRLAHLTPLRERVAMETMLDICHKFSAILSNSKGNMEITIKKIEDGGKRMEKNLEEKDAN